METRKCQECGFVISNDTKVCPNCGAEINFNTELSNYSESNIHAETKNNLNSIINKIRQNKPISYIIIGVIIAVIIIIVVVAGVKTRSIRYIKNMRSIADEIVDSASDAEDIYILASRVWLNSIYQEHDEETDKYTVKEDADEPKTIQELLSGSDFYDFSTAVDNMYSDQDIINELSELSGDFNSISDSVDKLQNPPKDMYGCYSTFMDLYSSYSTLVDLAQNPSGSYEDYSDKIDSTSDAFLDSVNKLKIQLSVK